MEVTAKASVNEQANFGVEEINLSTRVMEK